LFYRLNDIQINVPPLRERKEDIPVLVEFFIDRFSASMGKSIKGISSNTSKALMDYHWPGNVRELEKAVQRMMVLADEGTLVSADLLPEEISRSIYASLSEQSEPVTLKESLAQVEKDLICRSLNECGWNRSEVSRRLKISYPALLQKIRRYGIKERDWK
jgi:DNA-binding NtrC family response regulator